MNDQRLIEMETKILFQEDTIEQLNQVVCEQQTQLVQIKDQLNRLTKHFKSLIEATQDIRTGHEKPPHY